MLAELIENATVFSPPNTQVEVRGDRVGHGFAIEIEDRGLGMPAELLNTLNARLAAPPEFDLANSDQLGLFVAARLAQRHGIKLSLRPSPFGGTTAIVLLPLSIIANDQPGWTPGAADSARGMEQATAAEIPTAFGLTGRHRRETPQPAREQSAPLLALTPAPEPSPWFGPGQAGSGGEVSDPQFPDFPSRQPEVADFPSRQPEVADFPSRQPELTVVAKDGSRPGLPRRSRGTNLSPHLQATRGAAPAPPAPDEDWPDRSPEDAGTLMSDLQGGWERARMAHSDDFDGED
jgi:hypothetical protein